MSEIQIDGDGKIVLVDDDTQFHDIFRFIYKKHSEIDNKLLCLCSGEELLEYVDQARSQPELIPSVVLMDINMPGRSGIETLRELRKDSQFSSVPIVVMLTSSNFQGDIDEAYNAGASDYVEKPFNLTDIKLVKTSSEQSL